jgi:hypothetical protein
MACHWKFPSHQMNTNAAAVDSSLQLSISAQAVGMASLLSFHYSAKHAPPAPFLKLIWAR